MVHLIIYEWPCPMDCKGHMSEIGVMANHLKERSLFILWPVQGGSKLDEIWKSHPVDNTPAPFTSNQNVAPLYHFKSYW